VERYGSRSGRAYKIDFTGSGEIASWEFTVACASRPVSLRPGPIGVTPAWPVGMGGAGTRLTPQRLPRPRRADPGLARPATGPLILGCLSQVEANSSKSNWRSGLHAKIRPRFATSFQKTRCSDFFASCECPERVFGPLARALLSLHARSGNQERCPSKPSPPAANLPHRGDASQIARARARVQACGAVSDKFARKPTNRPDRLGPALE